MWKSVSLMASKSSALGRFMFINPSAHHLWLDLVVAPLCSSEQSECASVYRFRSCP
jgi:hypothetical protein